MNSTYVGASTGFRTEPATDAGDSALFRKVAWRIIPVLFICYVLNYLDRTNIGYANLQMKELLGFTDAVFGIGASIFFVGFALFEVPSNMMLARIGMRATLMRIMVLWGLASTAMVFVTSPTSFYVLRFLVGVFEAGFGPGVLFFLTLWFPAQRRAQVAALFFMAFAAAPIVAGPLAALSMTYMDGWFGLHGWQWLFIIEGVPTVLVGIWVFFYLDNKPADARWLSEREKTRLAQLIAASQSTRTDGERGNTESVSAFRDPRVWLVGLMSFLITLGVFAMAFWQPTMLKSMGLTVMQIGFFSTIPAALGVVASLMVSRRSDRLQERRWHFAITAVLGAGGLCGTTFFMNNPAGALVCLSVSAIGISSAYALLWSIPGVFLQGRRAATGIAIITTMGASAGMVAPAMVGLVRTATGSFVPSLYVLSGCILLSALLMVLVMPRSSTIPAATVL
ncbi:MFS transporter [Variovorax sp. LARHSF232]